MTNRIPAFIVDLDGTTAIHTEKERGHFQYELVYWDKPNETVISVVKTLARYPITGTTDPALTPLFVTGRPDKDKVREDTADWLKKHTGLGPKASEDQKLFMRPGTLKDRPDKPDYRQDYIVKEEIYWEQIEPYYDVKFAIDDRPQVLKMWHRIGIPTFAVGTPWIDF